MEAFVNYLEKTVPKRQRQNFIDRVAQSTPDIIYIFDLKERRFIFINDRVSTILGDDPEFIYSQGPKFFLKRLHPDDYLKRMEHMTSCAGMKKHEVMSIDLRIRVRDNTWRWFRVRDIPFTIKNGEVTETIGAAREIHELKLAEEEIRHKEALLRTIIDIVPDRLQAFKAIRNNEGEIEDFEWILINKASEDNSGRRIGKRLLEMFPGVIPSGLFQKYKQVVETGKPFFKEGFYNYDGINNNYRLFASKLDDGFVILSYDIQNRTGGRY
jgi:PAS domain S-box-containing protein